MNEQEEKRQEPTENLGDGDQPKDLSPIERANLAAARAEKAAKESNEAADRLERLKVEETLSGRSPNSTQAQKKVLSKEEENEKIAEELGLNR